MARSAETCIFCAPDPCTCRQEKPRAKKASGSAAVGGLGSKRTNATIHEVNGRGDARSGSPDVMGELRTDEPTQGIQATIEAATPKNRPGLGGTKLATPARAVVVRSPDRRTGLASAPNAQPIDQEDTQYRRALTVLCTSGLICADDIMKYQDDLDLTESEKRQLIWRQKRVENAIRLGADAAG